MEGKRFLGVKLETLTAAGVILGPSLITLCVVAAMLYSMNAKLIRIEASVQTIAEQAAANGEALEELGAEIDGLGAAIEELGAGIKSLLLTLREFNDELDALSDDTERAR